MWEWEHEDGPEERELEMLRLNKYETAPEWLDPDPRLREDLLALKRLTALEKPAVTRCRVLESMNYLYILRDASSKGFGLGLWYREGLRHELENWSKQWKTRPPTGRREPILLSDLRS